VPSARNRQRRASFARQATFSRRSQRVLGDLSLTMDGERLRPRLVSSTFPGVAALKEGLGEIQLTLAADVPRTGSNRKLVFENHHERPTRTRKPDEESRPLSAKSQPAVRFSADTKASPQPSRARRLPLNQGAR